MPQDDKKGPSSTRGKSPAPTAPDTPDTRAMHAPASPEPPETEQEAEPVEAMEGDGTADADAGEEADSGGEADSGEEADSDEGPGDAGGGGAGADTGGAGGKSEPDRLRDEIAAAEKALEAKKAALARAEERHKAEEATAQIVADYKKEIPALTAIEDGLKQTRLAEISFLGKFLDEATIGKIEAASAAPQREIDDLAATIEAGSQAAAGKKAELEAAKAKTADAKAKAEALKRPAASIRDRLKAADAIRAEAHKASDAGNYALAYWLIMAGGRLDEKMKAEPRIIPASDLDAAVRQAASDQAKAEQDAARLEGEIKALEAGLQADRAKLAALNANREARVRDSITKLNPKSAKAA